MHSIFNGRAYFLWAHTKTNEHEIDSIKLKFKLKKWMWSKWAEWEREWVVHATPHFMNIVCVSFLLHVTCHHCSNFASLCFTTLPISTVIHFATVVYTFFTRSLTPLSSGCGRTKWIDEITTSIVLVYRLHSALSLLVTQWRKLLRNNHWVSIWIEHTIVNSIHPCLSLSFSLSMYISNEFPLYFTCNMI